MKDNVLASYKFCVSLRQNTKKHRLIIIYKASESRNLHAEYGGSRRRRKIR